MTLKEKEFLLLNSLRGGGVGSQRELAAATGLSLGTVNHTYRDLESRGLLDTFTVTEQGFEALQPYRVGNAIIMAAGFASRFAPLSYERPKGMLSVRGEVLIERQIRQLQEAGITDITVVVGYMKESFFYLEDRLGVKIAVNEQYVTRNNNSTLMLVADRLANTYICSSDNYFAENVFEPYVYQAYYSAVFVEGPTDEYCLVTDTHDRIVAVPIGGSDADIMLGHVYFDAAFSARFRDILRAEYDWPETAPKLWEDIYMDHIDELDMHIRRYPADVIYEFDSLRDMLDFDHDFVSNVDSQILDNICAVLHCDRSDIRDIDPLKDGLTNLSFRFDIGEDGRSYVYRHPGNGTEEIISRESEAFSQNLAKKLGIDDTFIYEDPAEGWKISHYIDTTDTFDYHNSDHVEAGLELIRRLHTSGETSQWTFGVYAKAVDIVALLGAKAYPSFPDFEELATSMSQLNDLTRADGIPLCICHNDFYPPNFLIRDGRYYLIDWEYSAMSDYASDLGTFICCSDYTLEQAKDLINRYFGGTATDAQMRHCLAFVALSGYQWFVWALYKEACGNPVGEWLYLWYRSAKTYGRLALDLYHAA